MLLFILKKINISLFQVNKINFYLGLGRPKSNVVSWALRMNSRCGPTSCSKQFSFSFFLMLLVLEEEKSYYQKKKKKVISKKRRRKKL